jgi:hypothetical protein
MLPDIDSTVDIWAWALRPIVRGERGGDRDTEWRVRPTGAQTVTLGGAQ